MKSMKHRMTMMIGLVPLVAFVGISVAAFQNCSNSPSIDGNVGSSTASTSRHSASASAANEDTSNAIVIVDDSSSSTTNTSSGSSTTVTTTTTNNSNSSTTTTNTTSTTYTPATIIVYSYTLLGSWHLLSLNKFDSIDGFLYEGAAFKIHYDNPNRDLVPLYRCSVIGNSKDNFISLYSNCESQQLDGILGYVKTAPAAGYTALYRSYSSAISDHFITTDSNAARSNGWAVQLILGYVPEN